MTLFILTARDRHTVKIDLVSNGKKLLLVISQGDVEVRNELPMPTAILEST